MFHLRPRKGLSALVFSLGILAACSTGPAPCEPAAASATSADVGYELDAGDEVQVTVYQQPDLSGRFRLDGNGDLALPLAGEIKASRLTSRTLEQAIVTRLRDGKFLLNPQVGVQILTYRPFYILGEIGRPGQNEYRDGMSVITAVALAGDYTYRAKTAEASIERGGCVVAGGPDTPILPGDIVTIPERLF
jgi:protein involved in polysaccharide export with SLBB domain